MLRATRSSTPTHTSNLNNPSFDPGTTDCPKSFLMSASLRMAGERFASSTATLTKQHTFRGVCRRRSYYSSASPNCPLEAWVSMMAPIVFAPCLENFYVQCCDNEAARHALIKGVGKHQPLNCLIAARWTWHNRKGLAGTPDRKGADKSFHRFRRNTCCVADLMVVGGRHRREARPQRREPVRLLRCESWCVMHQPIVETSGPPSRRLKCHRCEDRWKRPMAIEHCLNALVVSK